MTPAREPGPTPSGRRRVAEPDRFVAPEDGSRTVALTGQLFLFRSGATSAFTAVHIALGVCSPKMPGEPMRVQPSRAKKLTSEDA
jgi:hypothetical protein